jgi:methionine synthase reductase
MVAFSVVSYSCSSDFNNSSITVQKIDRQGLCTSYLEDLLLSPYLNQEKSSKILSNDCSEKSDYLNIFHKSTVQFRLPGSVNYPLILIGPGTGVAPFIGFLEHRYQLENKRTKSPSCDECIGIWRGAFEVTGNELQHEQSAIESYMNNVNPGPIWLFFGCRNEDDFLFKDTLENYLERKTLTVLETAMSRIGPSKVYVTHKLRERSKDIVRLLLDEGAYLYICGDGNHMAKDVHSAIIDALVTEKEMTKDAAEAIIHELKFRRRFVLDIWS